MWSYDKLHEDITTALMNEISSTDWISLIVKVAFDVGNFLQVNTVTDWTFCNQSVKSLKSLVNNSPSLTFVAVVSLKSSLISSSAENLTASWRQIRAAVNRIEPETLLKAALYADFLLFDGSAFSSHWTFQDAESRRTQRVSGVLKQESWSNKDCLGNWSVKILKIS